MRYTATVQWLHVKRNGDYCLRRKTVRNIHAPDIVTASAIALAPFGDKINPSISTIWFDWPQP